ncbi:MAG: TlpA family protein disulfide reductase [Spirochaetaceae bacterium]|nr:TlpA family protein disulfide reductase [Spirochaetaceae bacterium]MCF7947222.1 TlpA family protein disulfide reductase [Spirochaetia bacterium]MCF7950261.1 TlpA family protein disulfide reductase [Spirochaetaceae bacterium]
MQIGPFTIPLVLIRALAALGAGYVLQRLVQGRYKSAGRLFWDILFDMILAGFLLWKVAPLFLDPSLLWTDPMAALYRPGGQLGLLLGIPGAILLAVVQLLRRRPLPEQFFRVAGLTLATAALVFVLAGVVEDQFFQTGPGAGTAGSGVVGSQFGSEADGGAGIRPLLMDLSTALEGHGPPVNRQADFMVINAWASWCPPCRGEVPELIAFYNNIEGTNIELVALNMSSTENSMADVREFVENNSLPFPVRLDPEGELGRRLEIENLPTTIIIGPEGNVIARRSGVIDRFWLRTHTQR